MNKQIKINKNHLAIWICGLILFVLGIINMINGLQTNEYKTFAHGITLSLAIFFIFVGLSGYDVLKIKEG